MTNLLEGSPFKYLGVPLTSKRLCISHNLSLIDKIVGIIKHWKSRLLSHAGRVQLIKSVSFAITNYWMQCFPLPTHVIHKIEAVCRSFIWIGSSNISRKSPIAWNFFRSPKKCGGLNIIELSSWNNTTMLKLPWNLCNKSDSLWVKWVHTYYIKGVTVMDMKETNSYSWIVRAILKQRERA